MINPFLLKKENPYWKRKRIIEDRQLFVIKDKNKRTSRDKGQAVLVSHAILVGLSIFLVYAVITTFTSIRNDYQKSVGGFEIKELCFVMRGAINKVYTPVDYNVSTNTSFGQIFVKLPDRITDIKYSAFFFNKTIQIRSFAFNETCRIGFDADYNGSASGGMTRFSYVRSVNGTNTIEMVKA